MYSRKTKVAGDRVRSPTLLHEGGKAKRPMTGKRAETAAAEARRRVGARITELEALLVQRGHEGPEGR